MCNACGNLCCGSDEFGGCGCTSCGEPECEAGCLMCGEDGCDGDCCRDDEDHHLDDLAVSHG